ncbi:MAG TPA: hypothetical protein VMT46_09970 [Anaerolineaceae bacterium]|nr:hypothetical protein [Anaerolineaceae bacterium]
MEILNVGPFELLFIIIIALLVLGPRDMVRTGQKIGLYIRKVIQSPAWQTIMTASREIRQMPTRLVRETGLEDDLQELKNNTQIGLGINPHDIQATIAPAYRVDVPLPPNGEPQPPHNGGVSHSEEAASESDLDEEKSES